MCKNETEDEHSEKSGHVHTKKAHLQMFNSEGGCICQPCNQDCDDLGSSREHAVQVPQRVKTYTRSEGVRGFTVSH